MKIGRIDARLVIVAGLLSFSLLYSVTVAADPDPPSKQQLDALRTAIQELITEFGSKYRQGDNLLSRLDELEQRLNHASGSEVHSLAARFARLQREALLANPLVTAQPILFVVRNQYKPDHHNTATMFVTGEINTKNFQGGGALKSIDFGAAAEIKTILRCPKGIIRDPEVHFTGKKIIFSMRRDVHDDYHIYEINPDGSGLKQLTSAPGVADFDPLYLPDGSIVFSSTREPKYCMCNRHIMGNLFRMDGDGANIHQIGKSTLHEGHSALLGDGRVVYDRWEYVDRNFGDAQGLWIVNPDGTNHCIYWGNNTWSPGAVIDPRPIPGTEKLMCIFSSCHDRPWGALAMIDRRLGIDGRAPVVRTWPSDAIDLVKEKGPRPGVYGFDSFKKVKPKYEDPYPLSDKYFLCARMTGKGEQMGIYLLDVFGNEVLVHAEAPGCFDPMPLGPRARPRVIPPRRDFNNNLGYFYVVNVYQGTHTNGVKRGTVRYLRVVESPEKRFWTHPAWAGQGVHCPAMNWHSFENKRILGTVPVEQDGSAYFAVPSDKFVYFQLLDENKMMIQSMRSGTIVQSGEVTGCIGCHEDRRCAPPELRVKTPIALRRPPSKLEGWLGPPRLFNYAREVQPVFDRHCVSCHDFGKKASDKLVLAGDRTNTFNASYNELWRKKYISAIGAGPSNIQPAYSWGSHASKLVEVIRSGHEGVKLTPSEFERIVTWIDINGPYYPRYATAYPNNLAGRSPLNNAQIKRLAELTGVPFATLADHRRNTGPQISFDRPELSPCLKRFKSPSDPAYLEALAIIRAGKEMLAARPRADMDGFQPCPLDQQRERKYALRRRIELSNRQAIQQGYKLYDKDFEYLDLYVQETPE